MIVIVSGQRGGKTVKLLTMMSDNPDMVLVSHTAQAATAAWIQAKQMGLDLARHRFMSAGDVIGRNGMTGLRGLYNPSLLVDNAELVLAALFGGHVPAAMTMTGDTE